MTLPIAGFSDLSSAPEERGAILSPCKTYRYVLWRIWNRSGRLGLWVMLNPSTGDAESDDSTIANIRKRAKNWGWGGFYVVNLCAFRSSHPTDLPTAAVDPRGPENDAHIARLATETIASGAPMVVAWGSSLDFADTELRAGLRGRDAVVMRALTKIGEVSCIGRSGPGNRSPTHPAARGKHLVPVDAPLLPFAPKDGETPAQTVGKIVPPFSVKPPHVSDRPTVGAASRGPCGGCGAPSEGRYSVEIDKREIPLCDVCGPRYHPTFAELRTRYGND